MNRQRTAQFNSCFAHFVICFYRFVSRLAAWTTPTTN